MNDARIRPGLVWVVLAIFAMLAACGPDGAGEGGGEAGAAAGGAGETDVGDPAEAPARIGPGAELTGIPAEPEGSASSAFWDHWGDGRAELDSYRAVVPRYGERRRGELVLIYVTEPHDRRTWIKDDGAEAPDRVEVLKLNSSLKFLTGIYPYSVMTSVFSPVADWGTERFQPVKIGHSVQEWCGHYFHQVWPGRELQRSLRMSYFPSEGEVLTQTAVPEGTLYEDALLIQLRELDGGFAGGGDWEGWMVPSLWNVRRGVADGAPVRAAIRRESVEAGSDSSSDTAAVTRFTLSYGDYTRRYDVEAAPPRRILGWTTSVGDTVRLVRTRRLPYWTQNDPEGRAFREELGLSPTSSGIPPRTSTTGAGAPGTPTAPGGGSDGGPRIPPGC